MSKIEYSTYLVVMQNSTNLSKKLTSYSGVALALAGFSTGVDAQINYSGTKNISMNASETKDLDLNGDGTTDYEFKGSFSTSFFLNPIPSGGSWIKNSSPTFYDNVIALGSNAPIEVNNPTFAIPPIVCGGLGFGFINSGDKYIGVRFQNSQKSKTYIGWIRVDVKSTLLTIKDWAYEEAINGTTTINAGQQSLPTSAPIIKEELECSVFPTLINETITIKTTTGGKYQFVNLNGVAVSEGILIEGEQVISTSNLKKGIYLVKISTENGSVVKRVVKN